MSSEVRTVRDPFTPFLNKLSAAEGKKSTDSTAKDIKVIESSIETIKTALRAARKREESVVDEFAELTRKIDNFLGDLPESTRKTVDFLIDGGEIVIALEALPSSNGSLKSEESEPDALSTVKRQKLVKQLKYRVQAMASEVPKKFPSSAPSSNLSSSFQTRRTGDTAHEEELKKKAKGMNVVDPGGELIFQVSYSDLEHQLEKCLLCFAVFPENQVIKKHDMIYWWIGEGLVVPIDDQTAEQVGEDCFKLLMLSGLIEPIHERDSKNSKYCIIHPRVRKMLVRKAKESAFFSFDEDDSATLNSGTCRRACLAATGKRKSVAISGRENSELLSIFNLTAQYLSCNEEELRKMEKIISLQLGRWQNSSTHHIEVVDTKFLNGLKFLKELRYLSLQGISRITELPDSIGKLSKLLILDLRSCHNLEHLPSAITSLKALTHLDASECFLLDKMPQGIGSMSNLEVLKGFVIGSATSKDRCRVSELAQLKKLWKLSIHIGSEALIEEDFNELSKIEKLKSLMVTWGRAKSARKSSFPTIDEGRSLPSEGINQKAPLLNEVTKEQNASSTPRSLERLKGSFNKRLGRKGSSKPPTKFSHDGLEKLSLQCVPDDDSVSWLLPNDFPGLKRLYIVGGNLSQFSLVNEDRRWKVEILHLKFLKYWNKKWHVLKSELENLQIAEIFECPKINSSLIGFDENGVWVKSAEEASSSSMAGTSAAGTRVSVRNAEETSSGSVVGTSKGVLVTNAKEASSNSMAETSAIDALVPFDNKGTWVGSEEEASAADGRVPVRNAEETSSGSVVGTNKGVLVTSAKEVSSSSMAETSAIDALVSFDNKGNCVGSEEEASSSSMAGTSAAGTRVPVRNAEETNSGSVVGTSKGVLVTNAKEASSSSMAETSAIDALVPFDNKGTWVGSEEEASASSMAGTSAADGRVPVRNAEETNSGSVVGTNKGVLVTSAKEVSSSSMAETSAIDALVPFDNKETCVISEEEASSSSMAGISIADAAGDERGMTIPKALVCTSETIVR